MKKNYHHSRNYRQLKYAVKQLKNKNRSDVAFTNRLLLKIKCLVNQLKTVITYLNLKRLVVPAFVILGSSIQNPVIAQEFLESVKNPFDIVLSNQWATSSPEFIDLDSDGDFDLVLGVSKNVAGTDTVYGQIKYYENIGSKIQPQFEDSILNPFENIATNYNAHPSFTDVDKDGDFDLFVSEYYSKVIFYENVGDKKNPVFEKLDNESFGLEIEGYNYNKLVFVDMDNDGDEDCFSNLYDEFIYFENTSNNEQIAFQNELNIKLPSLFDNGVVMHDMSDIDSDGDFELVFYSLYQYEIYFYENEGDKNNMYFNKLDSISFEQPNIPHHDLLFPTFVDLDSDGDQDIMFGSYYGDLYFYENVDSIPEMPTNIFENDLLNISIYPNPTTEVFYLNNFETINSIEIFNGLGQTVKQIGKPQQSISLDGLTSTTYFVKITDQNGAQTVKKVYKQ